mmetsp:Transcript_51728/g.163552  ORF Transcript_51728/g.163552 Transcript_51728/m.163552 type:complete len:168 (-) Transcript_51728:97-600(-)
MPHSYGSRARTRDLFSRGFRKAGTIPLSTYLRPIKRGDYVDIKANSAVQKGMPHKFYHGKTGIVFNVTKSSVGVEVNKIVRGKVLVKRVNLRVEHVKPSRCREEFLNRVKANDRLKREDKIKGGKRAVPQSQLQRFPVAPKAGYVVKSKCAGRAPVVRYATLYDDVL